MPNSDVVTNLLVEAQANLKDALVGLDKLSQKIDEASSKKPEIQTPDYSGIVKEAEQIAINNQKAIKSYAELKQELDEQTATVDKYSQSLLAMQEAGDPTAGGKRTAQYEQTAQNLVSAQSRLKELEHATFKAMGTQDQMARSMQFLGNHASQLASRIGIVTAALSGLIGLSIKQFADFEQSSDLLEASLGGLSSGEFDAIINDFQLLSTQMPVATNEMLTMASAAAEAGVSTQNLVYFTRTLARLTAVTDELDFRTVAEDLRGLMLVFGMHELQVEGMASALRRASKDSSAAMDELISATMNAASAAQSANLSYEQTLGILQVLSPQYSSAAKAGTGLRNVLREMYTGSEELGEILGKQNTIVQELNEDGFGVLVEVIERYNATSDNVAAANALEEVFNDRSIEFISTAADNVDEFTAAIQTLEDEMANASTLSQDYATATDNLASEFTMLQNTAQFALVELGAVFAEQIAPVIEGLRWGLLYVIGLWRGLSDETKKNIAKWALITVGVLAAVTALLTFGKTLTIIYSMMIDFQKIVLLVPKVMSGGFGALAIAPLLKFIVVIGAVIIIVRALIAALQGLMSIFGVQVNLMEEIKKKAMGALGLDKLSDKIKKVGKDIDEGLKNMGDAFTDAADRGGDAVDELIMAVDTFGRSFMENFLYVLEDSDWQLLDSLTEIAAQYYEILKQQGKITEQQAAENTLAIREVIAQAITEMRDLGRVTEETQQALIGALGTERGQAVIDELVAAMEYYTLKETVDAITKELETLKDELRAKVEAINEQIEDIKDLYEDDIEAQEDIIEELEDQKDALEDQLDEEIKVYEERTELAEEEYERAKDKYNQVKDENDREEDIWEDRVDMAKDGLDEQKDLLRKWRDLRKKEVEAAEGRTEWAEMSYDASLRELEILEALGRDEFDAQYRAVRQRTELYSDRVTQAKREELLAKQSYRAQEEAAEARIDTLEDEYDLLKDQLDTLKKINKEEEEYFEGLKDLAKERYENEKDALEAFKESYQEQIEAVQNQIDVHKDMLDDLKDARDEQIEVLEDQKEAIEKSYEDELEVLEERKRLAEDQLDEAEDLFKKEQRANDERLRVQDRLNSAASNFADDLGNTLSSFNSSMDGALGDFIDDFNSFFDEADKTFENEVESRVGDTYWGEDIAEWIGLDTLFVTLGDTLGAMQTQWFKELKGLDKLQAFLGVLTGQMDPISGEWLDAEGVAESWSERLEGRPLIILGDLLFGPDWEKDFIVWIHDEFIPGIVETFESIKWGEVLSTIVDIMFPPLLISRTLYRKFQEIDWEKIKNDMTRIVSLIQWGKILLVIAGTLFPPRGFFLRAWEFFIKDMDWERIKEQLLQAIRKPTWNNVVGTLVDLIFPDKTAFAKIIKHVLGINSAFEWKDIRDSLIEAIRSVPGGWSIVGFLGDLVFPDDQIERTGYDAGEGLLEGASQGVQDGLKQVTWGSDVSDTFSNEFDRTRPDYENKGGEIIGEMDSGFTGRTSFFANQMKIGMIEALNNMWGMSQRFARQIGLFVIDKISEAATGTMGWLGRQLGGGLLGTLIKTQTNIYGTAKGVGKNMMYYIRSGAHTAMSSLGDNMYWWAKHAIYSFTSGIYDSYSAIYNAAYWMASVIQSLLGFSSPPSEGPLHYITQWGEHLVETYADAIDNASPNLSAQVTRTATVVADGINLTSPSATAAQTLGNGVATGDTSQTSETTYLTEDNSIHIHAGNVLATDAEVRQFARKIRKVNQTEIERRGLLQTQ